MADQYPYSHSDAVDNVTWSTAALHNQQGQAVRDLVNALPVFKVDPDDSTHCYTTINAAYTAANAALGANEPALIVLAAGKNHTLSGSAITFDGARDVYLIPTTSSAYTGDYSGNDREEGTMITGDITLSAADGGDRRILLIDGVYYKGSTVAGSNWLLKLTNGLVRGTLTRTHGANGVRVQAFNMRNVNVAFQITDVDAAPSNTNGSITMYNCRLMPGFQMSNFTFWSIKNSAVDLVDCEINFMAMMGTVTWDFFDLNGTACTFAARGVRWVGTLAGADTLNLFANVGSATIWVEDMTFTPGSTVDTYSIAVGGTPTNLYGAGLLIRSHNEPGTPFLGTRWDDLSTGEIKRYDGTQWLRESGGGSRTYFVDGSASGDGAYATILAAFTAADAAEASGAEIKILVADGTYSDNVDFGTNHPVVIESVQNEGAEITGDLTFGATGSALRREIRGCLINGSTINIKDGAFLDVVSGRMYSPDFQFDPTAGSVGYGVRVVNCITSGSPHITETASPAASTTYLVFSGGTITFESITGTPISIHKLDIRFDNISTEKLEWTVYLNPLVDANGGQCSVKFNNFAVNVSYVGSGLEDWFVNASQCAVQFVNATFYGSTGKTMAFGTVGTVSGSARIVSDLIPENCPPGTVWEDTSYAGTNARILIYTGGSYPIWRDLGKPRYYVDGSITDGNGAYRYVNDAYAAADAAEASGAEIKILVADGTYSDNVDFLTNHPVIIEGIGNKGAVITGDLSFGNYASATRHVIRNCELDNNTVTVKDGTNLLLDQCRTDVTAFSLNPTAGTVGYWVRLQNCEVAAPTITETASSTGTRRFVIDGGTVTLNSLSATPISIYDLHLKFLNIAQENLEWTIWTNPLINCNSDSATVWFSNFNVMNYYISSGLTEWFTNAGSATVYFDNAVFRGQTDGKTMELGAVGTVRGFCKVVADTAPVNMPDGTIWYNYGTGRTSTYVYDASYPYWKDHGWLPGEAYVDDALGDATASTGAFDKINDAYNALNATLAANEPITLKLAPTKTHTLTGSAMTVAKDRDLFVSSLPPHQTDYDGSESLAATVVGDFTLADATGEAHRRTFHLDGVHQDGDITANPEWLVKLTNGVHEGTITRSPAGGNPTVEVELNNIKSSSGGTYFVDGGLMGWGPGQIILKDSYLTFNSTTAAFMDVQRVELIVQNTHIKMTGDGTNPVFDLNGASGTDVSFVGRSSIGVSISGATATIFTAASAGGGSFGVGALTVDDGGNDKTVDWGANDGTSWSGAPKQWGSVAPVDPPNGTTWLDEPNNRTATYVYHASYPFWNWNSWGIGEAYVDDALGDTTASTGFFDTVNDAYSALDAKLAAGEPIRLILAPGKKHTMTGAAITLQTDHSLFITAGGTSMATRSLEQPPSTELEGDITCPSASAEPSERMLHIEGVAFDGDINVNINWSLKMANGGFSGTINRTSDSGGVKNTRVEFDGVNAQYFALSETNSPLVQPFSNTLFKDSYLNISTGSATPPFDLTAVRVEFWNTIIVVTGDGTSAIFDYNGNDADVHFDGKNHFTFFITAPVSVVANHGAGSIRWNDAATFAEATYAIDFGYPTGTHEHFPRVSSTVAPTSPPPNTVWLDESLGEILVWNSTYWLTGG